MPGVPFKKGGDPRQNPGGVSRAHKEARKAVLDALEVAMHEVIKDADGKERKVDILVEAIVQGVKMGDSACIRLAAEYRLGKPTQPIDLSGDDGEPTGIVVQFVRPEDGPGK